MLEARAAPGQWFVGLTDDALERHLAEHGPWYGPDASNHLRAAHRHMHENYAIEYPTRADLDNELRAIIRRIPQDCKLVLLLTHPTMRQTDGSLLAIDRIEAYKKQSKANAEEFPHVNTVDFVDAVEQPGELLEADHFARQVYMRIANLIRVSLSGLPAR